MIFGEGRAKDVYRRLVWGPGRRVIGALPAPQELRLLCAGGALAGRLLGARRARLCENIGRAFPDSAPAWREAVAVEAFAAHFANQYFSMAAPKITAETLPACLQIEGLDRLRAALAGGRGAVLMHPHMGPAQLPLLGLGLLGFAMHQVGGGRVVAVTLSPTGRWAADTRARLEATMPVTLHDGKGFLRPVLRALGAGAAVMTACDATGGGEELGRRGVRTVLGQRFPVPVGPARLAHLAGAPLLGISCWPNPDPKGPRYRAQIEGPFALPAGRAAALEAGVDAAAAFLDGCLRRSPGQWLFWDGFAPGGLLSAPG